MHTCVAVDSWPKYNLLTKKKQEKKKEEKNKREESKLRVRYMDSVSSTIL